jgi:hypothetical protein
MLQGRRRFNEGASPFKLPLISFNNKKLAYIVVKF